MTKQAKADKLFSQYIRRSAANRFGYCVCVTCSAVKRWQDIDAGHFIDRRYLPVRYDERNVHPQCKRCNRILDGNIEVYLRFMQLTYGDSVIDELHDLSLSGPVPDYPTLISHLKEELKKLG